MASEHSDHTDPGTEHAEHKRAARFDFTDDPQSYVFVCDRVVQGAPILFVSHDDEGDWQFLCGGDHSNPDVDPAGVGCLECTVADDLTLNEVADLPYCWSAAREAPGARFTRADGTEAAIRDVIAEDGVFVMLERGDDTRENPPRAYTIGLHTASHPELILAGEPLDITQAIMASLIARVRGGTRILVGQLLSVEDVELQVREVAEPSIDRFLARAVSYHGSRDFRALQLVPTHLEAPLLL
jgi:hypothetical protein